MTGRGIPVLPTRKQSGVVASLIAFASLACSSGGGNPPPVENDASISTDASARADSSGAVDAHSSNDVMSAVDAVVDTAVVSRDVAVSADVANTRADAARDSGGGGGSGGTTSWTGSLNGTAVPPAVMGVIAESTACGTDGMRVTLSSDALTCGGSPSGARLIATLPGRTAGSSFTASASCGAPNMATVTFQPAGGTPVTATAGYFFVYFDVGGQKVGSFDVRFGEDRIQGSYAVTPCS